MSEPWTLAQRIVFDGVNMEMMARDLLNDRFLSVEYIERVAERYYGLIIGEARLEGASKAFELQDYFGPNYKTLVREDRDE